MELISTVTVGAGGAASISFSSIPQTYTDLVIVVSSRITYSGNNGWLLLCNFNGDTSNYSSRRLTGNGSTAASGSNAYPNVSTVGLVGTALDTANTFANAQIYVPNYTSSTNKSYGGEAVTENNGTANWMGLWATQWTTTSAITSIELAVQGAIGNFVQYSTASLYGITKGSGGATVS